jgi:hypothetical protein
MEIPGAHERTLVFRVETLGTEVQLKGEIYLSALRRDITLLE